LEPRKQLFSGRAPKEAPFEPFWTPKKGHFEPFGGLRHGDRHLASPCLGALEGGGIKRYIGGAFFDPQITALFGKAVSFTPPDKAILKEWLPPLSKKSGNFPKKAVLELFGPSKGVILTPFDPSKRVILTPFEPPNRVFSTLLDPQKRVFPTLLDPRRSVPAGAGGRRS